VRIPLDYYRILGLPIQATAEQLLQARRDRALQLPRREYSEVAIQARKQLIDEAYAVLSDPEQRQAYDASFLAKTYGLEPESGVRSQESGEILNYDLWGQDSGADNHTPSIEIDEKQFAGALLILQELGEYELVLKLSQPYLSSGRFALKLGRFGDPLLVGADMILTVALACLELGREQWQQGQYENAAASLETGLELLLQEGLFLNVRGEIQADLYKLRPYRILELLEKSESNSARQRKGVQLLRDMLQERGGIDGNGNDQSGLSVDDFLHFIQQLRAYLTAAEQQALFEAEARRPSAVATYLAVYACIAGGFAGRQPALIHRAKLMLQRLGKRQDVHLEQGICALLLGQTEDASAALELSQEYETLDFIRQRSENAPDLLPGLCLYAERWLQEEVFPHCRDLANQQVSLKEYFADEQVQAYLESLPAEEEMASDQWLPVASRLTPTPKKVESLPKTEPAPVISIAERIAPTLSADMPAGGSSLASGRSQASGGSRTPLSFTGASVLGEAENRLQPWPEPGTVPGASRSEPVGERRQLGQRSEELSAGPVEKASRTSAEPVQTAPRGGAATGGRPYSWRSGSAKLLQGIKVERLIVLAVLLLVLLGLIGFLSWKALAWLVQTVNRASAPSLQGEQPLVRQDRSPLPIPGQKSDPLAAAGPLTEAVAVQVIEKWLFVKAQALGPSHDVQQLQQILVPPALSEWQQRAEEAKRDNWYWRYQHSVNVESLQVDENQPNQATVEAKVREDAELYESGRLSQSRDSNFVVRYEVVRKDGQWRIQNWQILP
jgi:curved DNA-binding protein CbpA